MKWIKLTLGYCDTCYRYFVYPKTRRQSSQYNDDKLNHICTCKRCYTEIEESWKYQWDEYNRERM